MPNFVTGLEIHKPSPRVDNYTHTFREINSSMDKGVRLIVGTTSCGKDFSYRMPHRETLADMGLSAWPSDLDCPQCLARIGLALPLRSTTP